MKNIHNTACAMLTSFKAVEVTFSSGNKRWTYLSDLDLEVGDMCIVKTQYGTSVVTVASIGDTDWDIDFKFDYGIIVQKVDFASFNETMEIIDMTKKQIKRAASKKARDTYMKEVYELLGN